jgi:hypothetical protein
MDLYEFIYYPKYHEILPIWDETPLVIKLKDVKNGFIGVNLHYIINISDREFYYNTLSEFNANTWKRIKHIPGSKEAIHRYLFTGIYGAKKSDDVEKSLKTQGHWKHGKNNSR